MIKHSAPSLGTEEQLAVLRVMENGYIARGKEVETFEAELASRFDRRYAIAVNSGLAALHLALSGVSRQRRSGDCIVPSYTCDALLHAISHAGLTPIITDVDPETRHITADIIREHATTNTVAVIVPHTFGYVAELAEILALGIPVIEDAATAMGAKYLQRPVGGYGRASIFSFYPTKIMTTGEGGVLLTDDDEIAEIARDLRDYRKRTDFRPRFNYNLTDIAAAIGRVQLQKLANFVDRRRNVAEAYSARLAGLPLRLPTFDPTRSQPAVWYYVVHLDGYPPDTVIQYLRTFDIEAGHGVLIPLHRLSGLPDARFPVSAHLADSAISLPTHPGLTMADIDEVVRALSQLLTKAPTGLATGLLR